MQNNLDSLWLLFCTNSLISDQSAQSDLSAIFDDQFLCDFSINTVEIDCSLEGISSTTISDILSTEDKVGDSISSGGACAVHVTETDQDPGDDNDRN